ncbi:SusC/RagA family TonB-linked outer membrane protein [Lutibacter sp. A80]|uniref:SusC/RagA family TonB-linked outer membrane protein n=1 Tax=Lutibacter sp. A80 TaxID=2918453 RepID=UPI001F068A6E|nr:SusC/RagA family TonB-linked outer membrane protein [Lutibacter sp. A80]UMB60660.1 SusC/RagA family TonB-linked outer membrane protein [Lutibacter sp. A80]
MSKHITIRFFKKLNLKIFTIFISIFFASSFAFAGTTVKTDKEQAPLLTINKELTIQELFDLISSKTDYDFFFNSNIASLNSKVLLNVKNAPVTETLDIAFKNLDLEYAIKDSDIIIRSKTTKTNIQEKIRINGIVNDDNGNPLPGVNIIIKNTNLGTSTDFDGKFIINALPNDVLIFSYLGFQEEIVPINNRTSIVINLKTDSNLLNEVIIAGVASGTSRKKLSVSVAKIKSDALEKAPQSSVSSSLQGKIAGVTVTSFSGSPGASSDIVLRGSTSIRGGNNPMILIDGVIMGGSLADINIDDVESIEVVKGAAAASLYGSKAANGVIVVTSKRGKEASNGKTSITVRNEFGFQQVANLLDLSTSHHYLLDPTWLDTDTYTKYQFVNYPSDYVAGWDPRINGNRVEKEDHYQDLPYRVNNDLQEEMFNDGQYITNYIGLGYKLDDTNLFLSFENNESQGVVVETGGYNRQSLRFNADHSISEKLKISVSNNYIRTDNDYMGGGTAAFFEVLSTEPDVNLFQKNIDGQEYNFYPNQWNTQFANPLYDLWKKESTAEKSRLLSSSDINWKLNDVVSFNASYAFELEHFNNKILSPQNTIDAVLPNYLDPNADPLILNSSNPFLLSYTGGALSKKNYKAFNQTFRATVDFKKTWGELDFNGKLSYLSEDNHFESTTTNGTSFILSDFPTFNNFDPANIDASDYTTDIRATNYFAIGSFVYKDRYILDGLFRVDGSSLFGENERWQNYFRLSGAYRLTKDVEITGVQELKLRAAYGTSGLRPSFGDKDETFSLIDGVTSKNTIGNKNLKPSRSAELEVGLESSFLNRFRLEATYSKTKVTDQYLLAPLASHSGGFKYQNVNAGELESNTFEAMLNAKLISKNDLNWSAALTFDKTNQKITKLNIPEYTTGPRNTFRIKEGETFGTMYGVNFVNTLEQMQQQLPDGAAISDYSVNRDGVVVKTSDIGTVNETPFVILDENGAEAIQKIGDINPDFRLGLNTTLNYKGFSAYMLWQWKQGGDLYNHTSQYLVRDNRLGIIDQIHVKPENKKTVDYYQALYDADAINGFWVEDASYIKLNEASIYYTLDKKIKGFPTKYIEQIKIGVIGRNLVTITDYSGYDPQTGSDGFLFDDFGYPNFRNYSFSVEFKF